MEEAQVPPWGSEDKAQRTGISEVSSHYVLSMVQVSRYGLGALPEKMPPDGSGPAPRDCVGTLGSQFDCRELPALC